jgi:hypothetical protein
VSLETRTLGVYRMPRPGWWRAVVLVTDPAVGFHLLTDQPIYVGDHDPDPLLLLAGVCARHRIARAVLGHGNR